MCKVSGSWSEGQGYTVFNQRLPVRAAASRTRAGGGDKNNKDQDTGRDTKAGANCAETRHSSRGCDELGTSCIGRRSKAQQGRAISAVRQDAAPTRREPSARVHAKARKAKRPFLLCAL